MIDYILIALIAALIIYLVQKNKKKSKADGTYPTKTAAAPVATTSAGKGDADFSGFDAPDFSFGASGSAGSSEGTGSTGSSGGSAAPVSGDDASQFSFGSDDDFAAALSALTDEKPVTTPKPPVAEESAPVVSAAPTGSGVVRCKIGGKYDLEGTSARFENGKIYGLSTHGEYLIGSYNPEVTEVRNTRGEIIGRIDGNLIILTREGQVERLKSQGREKTPDELVLLCAERFSDRICSTENSEEMALCSSDDRACAAAFICLHYDGDGIGPKESELHRFWYSWM